MDHLCEAFQTINIRPTNKTLFHDIMVIFECWLKREPRLDTDQLVIQPGEFRSAQVLYDLVLDHISPQEKERSLMELMPYIDDYLEYYEMLNTMF